MKYEQMNVAQLQAEEDRIKSALSETDSIAADLRVSLQTVKGEIAKRMRPSPEPRVSDHALFRYMERVYNIDVEKIRGEILNDNIKAMLKMGATGATINGVKFKAKDGVLITVLS